MLCEFRGQRIPESPLNRLPANKAPVAHSPPLSFEGLTGSLVQCQG
jgi:hypothetical protein